MPLPSSIGPSAEAVASRYREVRETTLALARPLSEADAQVQSMPDASPTKWHLAHTTWFFETFVLEAHERGFRPFRPAYRVLFNSYYHGVGEQHARPRRGLVTRPGLAEVIDYRRDVDERVQALLARGVDADAAALLTLGLNHEQQHQELILTDALHVLSCNPLQPAYRDAPPAPSAGALPLQWVPLEGGLVEIGHDGAGFAFDNEQPRHRCWLDPYLLASRLVTQSEWAAFVADGGYREPRWWLAAGWDWVRAQGVEAPMHWHRAGGGEWQVFTLAGPRALEPHRPVVHVSLFEADAYARWFGARIGRTCRLPTEAEWEHAAAGCGDEIGRGNFLDDACWQAQPARPGRGALAQLFGDAWEWTSSAYAAYPGYRPWPGAAGEYNAKFMVNQYVLRGGSFATPRSHIRPSYRNFFPAETRWQFTGVRLASDAN